MANKVYIAPETKVTFKASGGDVTFTPTSVASGSARVSAQYDRGSGSKPSRYVWRGTTKLASVGAGAVVGVYLATSDGSILDGNVGTSDATISNGDKYRNLRYIGSLVCDKASDATEPIQGSGEVEIFSRYVSVVWFNQSGVAFSSTAGDHIFTLEPVPDEIQ